MGYYFYYPPENKIVVERYAYFLEKDFILQKERGRIVELEDEDILPSENTIEHHIEKESLAPIVSQVEGVIPIHRSIKTHKSPDRLCLNVEIDPDRLYFNVEVKEHNLRDLNEPTNYKAALSDLEFKKWLVAMNAEMQSMYDNKTDMDGKVHIYKARLVAKGYTQTYGVDYKETFSHVADIRAIRILIAIAGYYDYEIWQMDVKTAFLYGFLEEEIYMGQPEEMKRMQNVPYASVVGTIMYAVRCIRLDVAFAQNITSRFQQNSELRVNCYCDAGFETDRDDTESQTGYVFLLNGGAVVWKSSKQSTTAQHAT
nr:hypothetical protein [Tanacetum cinerariifolium]